MDRREILKRELRANAHLGLGAVGCHDVPAPPKVHELAVGDDGYVVSLDLTTGNIGVEPSSSVLGDEAERGIAQQTTQ